MSILSLSDYLATLPTYLIWSVSGPGCDCVVLVRLIELISRNSSAKRTRSVSGLLMRMMRRSGMVCMVEIPFLLVPPLLLSGDEYALRRQWDRCIYGVGWGCDFGDYELMTMSELMIMECMCMFDESDSCLWQFSVFHWTWGLIISLEIQSISLLSYELVRIASNLWEDEYFLMSFLLCDSYFYKTPHEASEGYVKFYLQLRPQ